MLYTDKMLPEDDPSGKMAEFVAGLKFEDLPEEHVDYIKKDVLDGLACILAGTTGPTVSDVRELVQQWSGNTGTGRVLVFGDRAPLPLAGFVNGTITRACDLGDTHNYGGHIVEWVMPAMLTGLDMIKEERTGKDFITAFAGGAEWGAREHVCIHLQIHTTMSPGECAGPRYATASLAKLYGLDKDKLWAAMGMAYGARPQSEQQKYNEGTAMVRVQHGYVVSDAIKSVALAARGIEAIKGIYMGDGGLLKNVKHGDIMDPMFLCDDLGTRWTWRDGITMKPYAGCKFNHTPIYSLLKLMKEHNFTYKDIQSLHYIVSNGCRVTTEPHDLKWNPKTSAEGMFSNPYSVAYAAFYGDCFLDAYSGNAVEENMANPEFVDFMNRISYEVDPECPSFDGYTTYVELTDGRKFRETEKDLLGNMNNPMTWDDVEHKFWNSTRFSAVDLGKAKYEKIIDLCKHLEEVKDIHALADAMMP